MIVIVFMPIVVQKNTSMMDIVVCMSSMFQVDHACHSLMIIHDYIIILKLCQIGYFV